MNLASLLDQWAKAVPDRPAIIDTVGRKDRVLTYGELGKRTREVARLFRDNGLKSGDSVLVFQPMTAEMYVNLLAMWRLGLTALFADPGAGAGHLDECCKRVAPNALLAIGKAHWLRLTVPSLRAIPRKFASGFSILPAIPVSRSNGLPPLETLEELSPEHPALITFTSGSTGKPKATLRTHGFLLAQHRVLERSLSLEPGEIDLATLPIFALANLASGLTTLIPRCDLSRPGFIDPKPVMAQIERFSPQRSTASPAFYLRLADGCGKAGKQMPSFKKIFTGGAPVFPRTLIAIEAVAPEARVEALYGSTEAEPISHIAAADISPADLDAVAAGKGLPAGRPVEEIDLRIVRVDEFPSAKLTEAEFLTYCLGPECAGEILVSGAHVLKGYLGGYGDEETKVKVGSTVWHRTGDAGYLDKKGRLWLLGRWESRIVREGEETLFPFAIECVASGHPAVEHAALSIRGGKPVLVVQIRRGHSAPTLAELGLANAGLDGIFAVSRMPLDLRHNAKINYPALAKLLGGGM